MLTRAASCGNAAAVSAVAREAARRRAVTGAVLCVGLAGCNSRLGNTTFTGPDPGMSARAAVCRLRAAAN
jgi:hypothetical protein